MKRRISKKNTLKKLGKRVHELRIQKNISTYELSIKSKLKHSKIKRLDKGYYNIYMTELFKVASALRVNASDLCIYT